jgi:hypothetical protein
LNEPEAQHERIYIHSSASGALSVLINHDPNHDLDFTEISTIVGIAEVNETFVLCLKGRLKKDKLSVVNGRRIKNLRKS